ncbi:hypothetical protein FNV43_RR24509 [Rhamnella rubrinervis]|uniref:Uncharacterized protein n=1 Tax=Rhamnella rubrinervis TaxID=2594499 RepID=A0A8K0GLA1_9ROSA|nr:hypothetical protein FNV43_RR24509 [Rhamnella rubrinervis]
MIEDRKKVWSRVLEFETGLVVSEAWVRNFNPLHKNLPMRGLGKISIELGILASSILLILRGHRWLVSDDSKVPPHGQALKKERLGICPDLAAGDLNELPGGRRGEAGPSGMIAYGPDIALIICSVKHGFSKPRPPGLKLRIHMLGPRLKKHRRPRLEHAKILGATTVVLIRRSSGFKSETNDFSLLGYGGLVTHTSGGSCMIFVVDITHTLCSDVLPPCGFYFLLEDARILLGEEQMHHQVKHCGDLMPSRCGRGLVEVSYSPLFMLDFRQRWRLRSLLLLILMELSSLGRRGTRVKHALEVGAGDILVIFTTKSFG